MTKTHTIRYFIPTLISKTREEYDVDFEYEDYLPDVPSLKSLPTKKLSKFSDPSLLDSLADELYSSLIGNFELGSHSELKLRKQLGEYLLHEVSLRDVVLNDEILEGFAGKNNLTPVIVSGVRGAGKTPATKRRRYVHLVLVKQHGGWKVDSYDSFMVEKR